MKKSELRAYTSIGEKVFLPFSLAKFIKILQKHQKSKKAFKRWWIGQALTVATNNNCDNSGKRHTILRIEWLQRGCLTSARYNKP